MRKLSHEFILMVLVLAQLIACNASSELGGTEAGNPPQPVYRELSGSVDSTDETPEARTLLQADAIASCVADVVVAINTDGDEMSADIVTDCTFAIDLEVGQTYAIRFDLSGDEVAVLRWDSGDGTLPTTALYVSAGDSAIAVGRVSFASGHATPTTLPLVSTDADGDGTVDISDSDDDNNGIVDVSEADCDLDGIPDAIDDPDDCDTSDTSDSGDSDTTEESAVVLEVLPRNLSGVANAALAANLSDDVVVRVNCEIDPTSVTQSSLVVTDELSQSLTCDFSLNESGDTLTCTHEAELFSSLTTYTATTTGLSCVGGSDITNASWSWSTVVSLL